MTAIPVHDLLHDPLDGGADQHSTRLPILRPGGLLCLICLPLLQWLVVQEDHVPDHSGSEAVAAAASPGAAVREPLQYLLVLRGERLAPSEFKNVQQKLCSKYRTTCQHSQGSQRGDGSHVLSDDTARQLAEEYTQPPHPKLWVPKNTRMAGRLLPMRSPMAAKTKVQVTPLDAVRTYEQELLAKLQHGPREAAKTCSHAP